MPATTLQHGPYALVTGASSGIGEEFARQLAARGFSLVLVARRRDRLDALAAQLIAAHKVDVRVVDLDLLAENALDVIRERTKGITVGLAVLNAGILTSGPFVNHTLKAEEDVVRLNVLLPMQLAHEFGAAMARAGRGGIILLSSTAGHQGVPYLANYAATKAYILALGQALNYELKRAHVDVMVLSPGPTHTEGVTNADGIDFFRLPSPMMKAEPVVRTALNALGKTSLVIPGFINRLMDAMGKYTTPRGIQTMMFGILVSRALATPPALLPEKSSS